MNIGDVVGRSLKVSKAPEVEYLVAFWGTLKVAKKTSTPAVFSALTTLMIIILHIWIQRGSKPNNAIKTAPKHEESSVTHC